MSIKPVNLILFTLGLAVLGLVPQLSLAEDRCATLGLNGYPAYCSPTGEGLAPLEDVEACCRGADCKLSDAQGECEVGRTSYSCEFAELVEGKLTCLFEVPDYCSVNECLAGGTGPVEPLILCCPYDDFESCFEYHPALACDKIWLCGWGASNDDGTYSCMEPEVW